MTIDGNNRIVLKAGNAERLFFVGPVTFRLRNITLREGNSLGGGGAIEASGAQVIRGECSIAPEPRRDVRWGDLLLRWLPDHPQQPVRG